MESINLNVRRQLELMRQNLDKLRMLASKQTKADAKKMLLGDAESHANELVFIKISTETWKIFLERQRTQNIEWQPSNNCFKKSFLDILPEAIQRCQLEVHLWTEQADKRWAVH